MMTLRNLKDCVKVADKKIGVPKRRELLDMGAEIVVKERVGQDVEICVFENGYVLYEEGNHSTVFRLHECEGYDYISQTDRQDIFQASFFENENWYMLLLMIGMDRVETNRRRLLTNHKVLSFDVEDSDYLNLSDKTVPDVLDRIIQDELLMEIGEILNERQLYVLSAYYCEGLSQIVIAETLGISQQAVGQLLRKGIKKIRDVQNVDSTYFRRQRNNK